VSAPGWEFPDVMPDSWYVIGRPGVTRPVGVVGGSGVLVPVTVWVCPDGLDSVSAPSRSAVRAGRGWRGPHVLAGVVVGVAVVATLAVCLVIALLALVAWVSAHAVAVGVGAAAVALTALLFVRSLAPARPVRPCEGWRHECE
jgi:hypothetical protein